MKGTCPACRGDVISKCGTKKLWHWAHAALRHCDSWWESETEWHRNWKRLFPVECQEFIQHDPATGEKHIADVRTLRGMVIEFQNSPISPAELKSREAFYGKMIWIVNAAMYAKNFEIRWKLPDPKAEFVQDLVILPQGRWTSRKSVEILEYPMRRSRREIASSIDRHFAGHYEYYWWHKRAVWLEATKPVFLDFGDANLWWLKNYYDRDFPCVQRIKKETLITKNGGQVPTVAWPDPIIVEDSSQA